MTARRFAVGSASVLALALGLFARESVAHADCANRSANGCINADSLWTHAGAQRFVGVGGSETVAAGQMGFGLDTSWLSRPIVLHVPTPGPRGSDSAAVNNLVDATFLFGYGVTDRFELDLALPMAIAENGDGTSALTGSAQGLRSTAIRDLRFGGAYAIIPKKRVSPTADGTSTGTSKPDVFGLTARFEMSAPTGQDDRFAGERGAVFVPSVAADYRRDRWFAGAELEARFRSPSDLGTTRLGSQLYIAGGVGYDLVRSHESLPRDLVSVSLEARVLPVLTAQSQSSPTLAGPVYTDGGSTIAPAEWAVAVRSAPLKGGDFAIQLSGGGALPPGSDVVTTPRFRFSLGIRFAPMRYDSDGDGVADGDDRCPTHAGSKENEGCDAAPAPPAPVDATVTATP